MANRTKSTDQAVIETDDGELDIFDQIANSIGTGANVKISLYRLTPGSGTDGAWITYIAPDQIEQMHEFIRDEYGGGTYVLRVKENGKFKKHYTFSIEGPRKVPGA